MSTKTKMIDASIRHQVYLQRYAGSQSKQILAFVRKLEDKIIKLLANEPDTLVKNRYTKLISAFKQFATALNTDLAKGRIIDLKELAKYEADYTKRLLDTSANLEAAAIPFETVVPATRQLYSAAFDTIMDSTIPKSGLDGGLKVSDALEKYGAKTAGNIIQTIRQGYAIGQSTDVISANIQDLLHQKIVRTQADSLARTITNHVAHKSRFEFYQENDDIITGYQIVAVLDSRTTLICASLDGKIFPKRDFDPPPYHWNCRSTFIGVVDPKYNIKTPGVTRPSKGADGTKAVDAGTNYDKWLRTQPLKFQEDVLGVERAKLFRDGAKVDSFVDHNYTPLTLRQLRAKDST